MNDLPHVIFGCGYLGRRVARQWLAQDKVVIAVTRSAERAAELTDEGILPAVGDICDAASLPTFGTEIDTVLFAVGYDRSSSQTQEQVFVDGLRNVLAKVRNYCRRFIYISSTSVYGQQAGEWVDEDAPCEPGQPGGKYCLTAEQLVHAAFENYTAHGSAVVLRCAGIYGPGRLLSRIADLKAGTPLAGSSEAWLNLIHVDDATTAVITTAEANQPPRTVLVADDQPIRRGEYYAKLAELIGAPPPVFDESQPRARGSGGLNKRCSNRRLKEALKLALRYPTIGSGLPASLADY